MAGETRKRLGVGRTAEVFEESERTVFKLFYPNQSPDLVESEYEASLRVFRLGLPVPEPLERIHVDGRQGIRYERASGRTMLETIGRTPWNCSKLARRLASLHVEIHRHQAADFPKLSEVWEHRIRHAPLLNDADKSEIVERLHALGGGEGLCHGDLHPDNVMIGTRTWVMDWMTGMSGNTMADAARTALILRTGQVPEGVSKPMAALVAFIQKRFYASYIHEYLKLSGRSMEEIEAWILPAAAARLVEHLSDNEKRVLFQLIQFKLKGAAGRGFGSQTATERNLRQ